MKNRLAVPGEDGAVLSLPPRGSWLAGCSDNCNKLTKGIVGGLPLADWRLLARQEALERARAYLCELDETPIADVANAVPIIVTGHQPELFHAGVWIKNYAVADLAKDVGGLGLSVLVDNDVHKDLTVSVPAGSPDHLLLAHIAIDRAQSEVPHEERRVLDEAVFGAFAQRAGAEMSELSYTPMLGQYWPNVVAAPSLMTLGERIAKGRRQLEATDGCRNLEVPLSQLTLSMAFRRLMAEIIVRLPEFVLQHNLALEDYRQRNRVRSRNHPVPKLGETGTWLEAPFWIWSADRPSRRRLWVLRDGQTWHLRADTEPIATLSVGGDDLIAGLANLLSTGIAPWKLRPRALMTTLFLRLGIADWFVHGVGGGKYDEMTDQLMRSFWRISPPQFAVLSATALLPIPTSFRAEQLRRVQLSLRDLEWNPDRHLPEALMELESLARPVERKYGLMAQGGATHRERAERFHEFRRINSQLRPYAERRRQSLLQQKDRLNDLASSAAIVRSREYAFCLHPEGTMARLIDSWREG